MSKLLHSKSDKDFTIDAILGLLQHLTFHGLSRQDQERVIAHFADMHNEPGVMDVDCRLYTNPITKQTKLTVACSFRPLVSQ